MRYLALVLSASCLMISAGGAEAAGCLKGAALGGIAGHFAGHHAVLGAVAGCAIGHHQANRQRRMEQNTREQPLPDDGHPQTNM